jgi:hypothetical protein
VPPGAVGTDQDSAPDPEAASRRQLHHFVRGDADVVGGGVGAGVAWSKQHRDGLAGAALAVVDEGTQE